MGGKCAPCFRVGLSSFRDPLRYSLTISQKLEVQPSRDVLTGDRPLTNPSELCAVGVGGPRGCDVALNGSAPRRQAKSRGTRGFRTEKRGARPAFAAECDCC